jgi:hypothetical protein
MERVLGATREARKEESWTVVNIAHYQSLFYGFAEHHSLWLFLHLLKMGLMSSSLVV